MNIENIYVKLFSTNITFTRLVIYQLDNGTSSRFKRLIVASLDLSSLLCLTPSSPASEAYYLSRELFVQK